MSQTITPRGLDELSADDLALLGDMRDDGPEVAPVTPPATDLPAVTDESSEIELPDEEAPTSRERAPRTETVPHAKFAAAIAERKTAKAAADAAKQEAADEKAARVAAEQKLATETVRINERIALLTALAQQPAQQAPAPLVTPAPVAEEPLPDVNTDPIGHFRAVAERQEKLRLADRAEVESLQGILKGLQDGQKQAREIEDLRNWGTAQEIAFQRQEPAYNVAMDYLRTNRDEELMELGITDPGRRQEVINEDITTIAQTARRDGVNFAERLYKQAVRRGFQKAPPAVVTPAAPVIPPLDAELAAVDRAARIEEGRANATTIGSLGAAPARTMSVEQILNLPDERFLELAQKMREGGRLQDLMGS